MNAVKTRKLSLTVLCYLLFVISCNDSISSRDTAPSLPKEKGSFSLTLSGAARTILPETPSLNDFAVYTMNFTPASGGSAANVDRTNETLATDPVLLDPGTYSLAVNAYKDIDKTQLAAQGTLNTIAITAGVQTSAVVTLEVLPSTGTGTFRWNITLPSSVTGNMIITPESEGGTAPQTVYLFPYEASGNCTLNSGRYSITFNMAKSDGKSIVWKELLYIYQNMESIFTFTFTDNHLNNSGYTVTYYFNNGLANNQTQSVLHGATLSVPAAPTRNGYTFGGWYTDNTTFTNIWDFDSPVIASFALYARWYDSGT